MTLRPNAVPTIFPPPSERKQRRRALRTQSPSTSTQLSTSRAVESPRFPHLTHGFSSEPLNLTSDSTAEMTLPVVEKKFPNLLAAPHLEETLSTSSSDSFATQPPIQRELLEEPVQHSWHRTESQPPADIVIKKRKSSNLLTEQSTSKQSTSTMQIKEEPLALSYETMVQTVKDDLSQKFPPIIVQFWHDHILLYTIKDTDNLGCSPVINFCLRILMDMTVRVWVNGTRLKDSQLDFVLSRTNGKITQWIQLYELLSKYTSVSR